MRERTKDLPHSFTTRKVLGRVGVGKALTLHFNAMQGISTLLGDLEIFQCQKRQFDFTL